MKTIDIKDIEDGYKLEFLKHFLIEKSQEIISVQATINEILGLKDSDISIVVKYLNDEISIYVGDNDSMKGAVKNGEI